MRPDRRRRPQDPPRAERLTARARDCSARAAAGAGRRARARRIGWGVGTQIETKSDIRELAPQSIQAVRELNASRTRPASRGSSTSAVEAPDLTDPATLSVDGGVQARVLRRQRLHRRHPSCLEAEVCPGPALSDFVVGGGAGAPRAGIRAALSELPAYDLRQVAPVDPRTGLPGHTALLSFGIRAQSLEDQQALIDRVRGGDRRAGSAGGPPPGVERRARRTAGDRRRGRQRPLRAAATG